VRIAVTGASGFLGSNLQFRLRELGHGDLALLGHDLDAAKLAGVLREVDFVFHFAGVNRPRDPSEFERGNLGFTSRLVEAMQALALPPRVVYASSIQAEIDGPYGLSKRRAEAALEAHGLACGTAVYIYRLPNVFGKWSRPNFNSVVATFCHNVARGLPIEVRDPGAAVRLVYVDDVLDSMIGLLDQPDRRGGFVEVSPVHEITVGELAATINAFRDSRQSLAMPRVGDGLVRALYSTYVSFLPIESFDYAVPRHEDARGVFVEMLKTDGCGQFSYFTAGPGVTRGEHYHHSKTEKFLVIRGRARFGFREIRTGQTHEITVEGGEARIVETVPGWAHNVTNVGDDELVVLLWANETFDRARPDTIGMKVGK
jgi:UDP-2-acetamido-2,6-beta-L-arabino-hexul-4-ose reductase